jgi:hypothetical protein
MVTTELRLVAVPAAGVCPVTGRSSVLICTLEGGRCEKTWLPGATRHRRCWEKMRSSAALSWRPTTFGAREVVDPPPPPSRSTPAAIPSAATRSFIATDYVGERRPSRIGRHDGGSPGGEERPAAAAVRSVMGCSWLAALAYVDEPTSYGVGQPVTAWARSGCAPAGRGGGLTTRQPGAPCCRLGRCLHH